MPKARLLDLDALLPYEPQWAAIDCKGKVEATFGDRSDAEFFVKAYNADSIRLAGEALRVIKTMVAIES